jgi:hypothetical protein
MKAISDLAPLWGALSPALRIETGAIAADDFHLGMRAKPVRRSSGRPVRQHVNVAAI